MNGSIFTFADLRMADCPEINHQQVIATYEFGNERIEWVTRIANGMFQDSYLRTDEKDEMGFTKSHIVDNPTLVKGFVTACLFYSNLKVKLITETAVEYISYLTMEIR